MGFLTLNAATAPHKAIDILEPLARQIRWQRFSSRLRFGFCLLAAFFVVLFVADISFGIRTLGLRMAAFAMLATACIGPVILWLHAWTARLDRVGLAQLLE